LLLVVIVVPEIDDTATPDEFGLLVHVTGVVLVGLVTS
jgi:hypothetical protein